MTGNAKLKGAKLKAIQAKEEEYDDHIMQVKAFEDQVNEQDNISTNMRVGRKRQHGVDAPKEVVEGTSGSTFEVKKLLGILCPTKLCEATPLWQNTKASHTGRSLKAANQQLAETPSAGRGRFKRQDATYLALFYLNE